MCQGLGQKNTMKFRKSTVAWITPLLLGLNAKVRLSPAGAVNVVNPCPVNTSELSFDIPACLATP